MSLSSPLTGTWCQNSWKPHRVALVSVAAALITWWSAKISGIASGTSGGQKSSVVGARIDWVRCVAEAFKVSDMAARLTSPLTPQAPTLCREEWLKRCRVAQSPMASNSPQEVAVARLLGPALGDALKHSQMFSKWSVASERYFKSESQLEGSARRGRVVATRAQLPNFRLKPILLQRVDDFASEGQGRLFWVVCRAGLERRLCETGQFRKFVDSHDPRCGPASDQDSARRSLVSRASRRCRGYHRNAARGGVTNEDRSIPRK